MAPISIHSGGRLLKSFLSAGMDRGWRRSRVARRDRSRLRSRPRLRSRRATRDRRHPRSIPADKKLFRRRPPEWIEIGAIHDPFQRHSPEELLVRRHPKHVRHAPMKALNDRENPEKKE